MNEQIAKIESTFLGYEDHGILTAYIQFQGGSWGQSGGGMMFSWRPPPERKERFSEAGMAFISGVLRACGVDNWERLVGRTVFVLRDETTHGKIVGIRPLPTERGKEFLFSEMDEYFQPFTSEGSRDAIIRAEVLTELSFIAAGAPLTRETLLALAEEAKKG